MKRRSFFGAAAVTAAATTSSATAQTNNTAAKPSGAARADFTGGLTAQGLLKDYRYWMFDDFLPFMDKFVIDHELGGFMCSVDRDGTQLSSGKSAWFEGRGIWTYAYLYNKLSHDPKHLETARKSVDFLMKINSDVNKPWPGSFNKDGVPAGGEPDIYGNLFIANGLQEYAKAKGNERCWDMAKEIMMSRIRYYDSPDYDYVVTYSVPPGTTPPPLKAPRVTGHWMVLLNLTTQMLEFKADPEVEAVAARSVDAFLNHHLNPDFNLINEVVNHDLSRNPDYAQFSYTGHAIETLWMVLHEAVRRKDRALWDRAANLFKRHIEVAWDDVYGGAFRALFNVDKDEWALDKVTWLQEEILIGTMFMIEHTGDPWAKEWFAKVWKYANEKITLKQYGFPLWMVGGDRKMTFERKAGRCEHFHHPRHLMQNILSLDRIIKRGGKMSGVFV